MQTLNKPVQTLVLTLVILLIAIVVWENFVRKKGFIISYEDDKELFAHTYKKVYLPKEKATVFIGSSRIKFDLDTDTWLKETNNNYPVQLACVGSSPIPSLNYLAADTNFKGNLIIDVTETLFFNFSPNTYEKPTSGIKYIKSETYAQKSSFYIDNFLQSKLVLLNKDYLTLHPIIDMLPFPKRKGVFELPIFPQDFIITNELRQNKMTEAFAADTNKTKQVQAIWKLYGEMGRGAPPTPQYKIDSLMADVKLQIDKIKSRGGEVVLIRLPSTGPELFGENMGFPRDKYWQKILDITQCKGIHFADYPELTQLKCPEFSHLDQKGAIVYTQKLIEVLKNNLGWKTI